MKTSVHLGYVLGALPFANRFPAARRLGFDAVEYPFPYEVPALEYAVLLADSGLQQISIGAPACDYRKGEPGFSLTPALQSEFDRSIDTAIDYATRIGCRNVHVFAGRRADDVSPEHAFETYCRNLQSAYDRLEHHGLRMVIEAINSRDFTDYFIDRLDRAVEAIHCMERPGTGIILDVYHASVNGEDPAAFLGQNTDGVAHVSWSTIPAATSRERGPLISRASLPRSERPVTEARSGWSISPPDRSSRGCRWPMRSSGPIRHRRESGTHFLSLGEPRTNGADDGTVEGSVDRHRRLLRGTRYEALPQSAIEGAKKSVLDTLGVILAAERHGAGGRGVVDFVQGNRGREEARCSPSAAAYPPSWRRLPTARWRIASTMTTRRRGGSTRPVAASGGVRGGGARGEGRVSAARR